MEDANTPAMNHVSGKDFNDYSARSTRILSYAPEVRGKAYIA